LKDLFIIAAYLGIKIKILPISTMEELVDLEKNLHSVLDNYGGNESDHMGTRNAASKFLFFHRYDK